MPILFCGVVLCMLIVSVSQVFIVCLLRRPVKLPRVPETLLKKRKHKEELRKARAKALEAAKKVRLYKERKGSQ